MSHMNQIDSSKVKVTLSQLVTIMLVKAVTLSWLEWFQTNLQQMFAAEKFWVA